MKSRFLPLTSLLLALSLSAHPADLDGDKRIDLDEFTALKKSQPGTFSEEAAAYLFSDKDRDGNGFLSYKELANHPHDLDDDKFISREEYHLIMKKRAERSGNEVKDAWVESQFILKDKNGDGKLSYREMATPVKAAASGRS